MKSQSHVASHYVGLTGILLSALCLGLSAFGQSDHASRALAGTDFDLSRHTVDGGGVMHSTGGDFELSGTIGQPDAGVMTGDDFALSGGFWIPIPLGDCEDDGDVDLMDYDRLTACLTGPLGGPLTPQCQCFDVNRSGGVDLADFAAMQSTYTGP